MKIPEKAHNESQRIANLKGLGILYSPAEERFDCITRLGKEIFNVPICLLSLVSEKCQWFKSSQGLNVSETSREVSFCAHAILQDDTLIIRDTLQNPDFADNPLVVSEPYIRFYAGQPINYKSTKLGTLCLIDIKPRKLKPSEILTLQSLARWAENEIKISALSEAQKELISELNESKRSSMIDPLTKLWNRKGMEELFPLELKRADRLKFPITLMFIDINKFKQINDKFGHLAGDNILKFVSNQIRSSLRDIDVVVRYGGDEFVIFLSNCDDSTSQKLASRIMSNICEEPIEINNIDTNISVSIGVCSTKNVGNIKLEEIINEIDNLMYSAKELGDGMIKYSTFN